MLRSLLLLAAASALLGFALGLAGCATDAPDTTDPCYSAEYGRVLPPLVGTDC